MIEPQNDSQTGRLRRIAKPQLDSTLEIGDVRLHEQVERVLSRLPEVHVPWTPWIRVGCVEEVQGSEAISYLGGKLVDVDSLQ